MLKMQTDALGAARQYLARGYKPVPIPYRKKKAVLDGWAKLSVDAQTVDGYFKGRSNIGLLLGEPSDRLVDVDLDVPEAVPAADAFLPVTDLVHGRQSAPQSHRYYRSTTPVSTKKFAYVERKVTTMIVELRSTGCQTVVPPSVHPLGELLTWHQDGLPGEADGSELRRRVALVATTALLARHWPGEGVRHHLSLALAGLLLRLGISTTDAETVISVAAKTAGDPEWADRARAVQYTVDRLSATQTATGGPTAADLLAGNGSNVVQTITKWLGGRTLSSGIGTAKGLLEIDATNLNLPDVSDAAMAALTARNDPPFIFQYGSHLVRAQQGCTGELALRPLEKPELRYELARSAFWYKTRNGHTTRALPPAHVLSDLLASPSLPLPILRRVVETPVFTREGILHHVPGYDIGSGLLYRPAAGFVPPEISSNPSPADLREAKRLLMEEVL